MISLIHTRTFLGNFYHPGVPWDGNGEWWRVRELSFPCIYWMEERALSCGSHLFLPLAASGIQLWMNTHFFRFSKSHFLSQWSIFVSDSRECLSSTVSQVWAHTESFQRQGWGGSTDEVKEGREKGVSSWQAEKLLGRMPRLIPGGLPKGKAMSRGVASSAEILPELWGCRAQQGQAAHPCHQKALG